VKEPLVPMKRRLGRPHSWSGHFQEDKLFCLWWDSVSLAVQPVS
jgi:hypothetical protein